MKLEKKLVFIFNPKAGKGKIKTSLMDIVDIFNKGGYEVIIRATQAPKDAYEQVKKYADKVDLIVCSGGDGTLDEVVTGITEVGSKVPVGYIPAGSTNDFASSLGIPKNMVEAAKTAVGGKQFSCDIGSFNGDYFVYVAAFGLFTEVSYSTSQEWKNVLGHAAYILEGAKCLHDIPTYMMQVEYNNTVIQDEFIYGMITNSTSVGGFKGMTGKDVLLDDGVFEVTLIKTPRNPIELNEIIGALINLVDDTDMVYSFKTNEVKFTSGKEISWTRDGEFGGIHTEVCIRNLKQAVEIMV